MRTICQTASCPTTHIPTSNLSFSASWSYGLNRKKKKQSGGNWDRGLLWAQKIDLRWGFLLVFKAKVSFGKHRTQ